MGFVNNFMMASNPQIVKTYAQNQLKEMFSLVINTAKMASYLLLIIGIPVFIEVEFCLSCGWASIRPMRHYFYASFLYNRGCKLSVLLLSVPSMLLAISN